jgi:hypothetical protein
VATFADVRRLALSLPEATEQETWGESTFRVRGRIFAIAGREGTHASVKASLDDQAVLVASDPGTFRPSPYTGRYGWVSVELSRVHHAMLGQLIRDAWRRTAPKRLAAAAEVRADLPTEGQ